MAELSANLAPVAQSKPSLNILTIENGIMANDERLHRLIDQIERTGAHIRRLFPSADIITVESTPDQFHTLQELAEVTAANLHRTDHRTSQTY